MRCLKSKLGVKIMDKARNGSIRLHQRFDLQKAPEMDWKCLKDCPKRLLSKQDLRIISPMQRAQDNPQSDGENRWSDQIHQDLYITAHVAGNRVPIRIEDYSPKSNPS